MVIMIDTNVYLDYILSREPYQEAAERILMLCSQKKLQGCMTTHSITDFFYITRKKYSVEKQRDIIKNLSQIVRIDDADTDGVFRAVNNYGMSDLEDSIIDQAAVRCGAEFIVTGNLADYQESFIEAVLPNQFLEIYDQRQNN